MTFFYPAQITTYSTAASEHATYLAETGDSEESESDTATGFGSSLVQDKKSKAKAKKKVKKASANPKSALFHVKWHRIVLGQSRFPPFLQLGMTC